MKVFFVPNDMKNVFSTRHKTRRKDFELKKATIRPTMAIFSRGGLAYTWAELGYYLEGRCDWEYYGVNLHPNQPQIIQERKMLP